MDLMIEAAKGYTLIVVDTLSRALGRAHPLDAVDMTLLLGGLQRLAARFDLALLHLPTWSHISCRCLGANGRGGGRARSHKPRRLRAGAACAGSRSSRRRADRWSVA